jgi:hypothetical protein
MNDMLATRCVPAAEVKIGYTISVKAATTGA